MIEPGKLVCLGHLTLDDIDRPDGAPHAEMLGGSALYATLAARLFERATSMVAPMGCDFPPRAKALLSAAGFVSAFMPARNTPTARLRHTSTAPYASIESLLTEPEDFVDLAPKSRDVPSALWNAEAFLVMAMPFRAQSVLLRACQARSAARRGLVLRQAHIVGRRKACLALLGRCDVVVTGLAEALYLLGPMEPKDAALKLSQCGPAFVAIDLGAHRYLVHEKNGGTQFLQPAYPVAPVDVTGATSAFAGAFMACLIQQNATITWAAAAAAVAASFAVSTPGVAGALAAAPLDAARRLALFVRPARK